MTTKLCYVDYDGKAYQPFEWYKGKWLIARVERISGHDEITGWYYHSLLTTRDDVTIPENASHYATLEEANNELKRYAEGKGWSRAKRIIKNPVWTHPEHKAKQEQDKRREEKAKAKAELKKNTARKSLPESNADVMDFGNFPDTPYSFKFKASDFNKIGFLRARQADKNRKTFIQSTQPDRLPDKCVIYEGIWEKHNGKDFFIITAYTFKEIKDPCTSVDAERLLDKYFKSAPLDSDLMKICTGVGDFNEFFDGVALDAAYIITDGKRRYRQPKPAQKATPKKTPAKRAAPKRAEPKYVFVTNYNVVEHELERYGSKVREVRIIYPPYEYAKDGQCKIIGWRPASGKGSEWVSRVTPDELKSLSNSENFNKVWGYVQSGHSRRNFDATPEEFVRRLFKNHYSLIGVIVIDEKKTTPKKKAEKKPSQVKIVRKLVSEGKIKAGHVRRLGIRKQTPPPPKSKKADEKRKALLAGYRVSKNGNLYYETRENRSDKPREKPRRGRRVPVKTTPKKGSKK